MSGESPRTAPNPPSDQRLADVCYRTAQLLVRCLAPVVPRACRRNWQREWEAELWHARRSALEQRLWSPGCALALLGRTLGTLPHALGLRIRAIHPAGLALDFRFALQGLRASPARAVLAVSILGLGIGTSTAIFSVVDALLLRGLPFEGADRLVNLWTYDRRAGERKPGMQSFPDYLDHRDRSTSFEALAAWSSYRPQTTGGPGPPRRLEVALVTHQMLDVLRVRPLLGRDFVLGDDEPLSPPTVLLAESYWRNRYGADPRVLGTEVLLDGTPHRIIGVLPVEYGAGAPTGSSLPPAEAEMWTPISPNRRDFLRRRGLHDTTIVGRLRAGVSLESAAAEVERIASRLERSHPESNANIGAWLQRAREARSDDYRASLWLVTAIVGLVLLIACASVATLTLSRLMARGREVAVRMALGAGRARIARLLLLESLLLAASGGIVGLALALATPVLASALSDAVSPPIDVTAVNGRVLGFTLSITLVTAILSGLAPALCARRRAVRETLLSGSSAGDPSGRRARHALLVSQIALTTLLVVAASVPLRGVWRLQRADPGFDPEGLLTVEVRLPLPLVGPEWPDAVRFFERAVGQVGDLPDVTAATAAYAHPADPGWATSFRLEGTQLPPGRDLEASFRPVLPGYFSALGIPVLQGREFTAADDTAAPGVVVINRAMAEAVFPGRSPIGRPLFRTWWWGNERPGIWNVVGVVEDVPFAGPTGAGEWATYIPHAQAPVPSMTLLIRARGDPQALYPLVRNAIWEVDRDTPVEDIRSMRTILDARIAPHRFAFRLLGSFAGIGLLLAGIGLHGALACAVRQRSREIGVRLALGAGRLRVITVFVGNGLALAGIGVLLGVGAAVPVCALLARAIPEMDSGSPGTYLLIAAFVLLTAAAASLTPALRASRRDPAAALRD